MRKVRVTASMKKEFAGLRDSRGNMRKGGVMRVPRILSCDEFQALAAPMQDKLIEDSYEDRYKPEAPVVIEDDTAARNAAENERLYQESRKAAAEGGLPLVRELERRVLRTTH